MKTFASLLLIAGLVACNSQASADKKVLKDSIPSTSQVATGKAEDSDCSGSLLFKTGAEIKSSSYDMNDKLQSTSVSTVEKVYNKDGKLVSEVSMKNTGRTGGERSMNAVYTCDGDNLVMDLSFLIPDNGQKSEIESNGMLFPLKVSEGEVLPDVEYIMQMKSGGRDMKIISTIKERKVEAKEQVTVPAGTFDCYRISSVVEARPDIPGMDEQTKKIMEDAMKKAGKGKFICWYVPDLTIIKMEFYMGDKMASRSEVTSIKR